MQIRKWPESETCTSLWYKETDNKQKPISIYLTSSKGWVNGVIVYPLSKNLKTFGDILNNINLELMFNWATQPTRCKL